MSPQIPTSFVRVHDDDQSLLVQGAINSATFFKDDSLQHLLPPWEGNGLARLFKAFFRYALYFYC
jgi:hypothetical protein